MADRWEFWSLPRRGMMVFCGVVTSAVRIYMLIVVVVDRMGRRPGDAPIRSLGLLQVTDGAGQLTSRAQI